MPLEQPVTIATLPFTSIISFTFQLLDVEPIRWGGLLISWQAVAARESAALAPAFADVHRARALGW
jgi:hypothetical protein